MWLGDFPWTRCRGVAGLHQLTSWNVSAGLAFPQKEPFRDLWDCSCHVESIGGKWQCSPDLTQSTDGKDTKMFSLMGIEHMVPRAEGSLPHSNHCTTLSPIRSYHSQVAEPIPTALWITVLPLVKNSDIYFTTACFYMCAASSLSLRHF